jgi:hypothetical protein
VGAKQLPPNPFATTVIRTGFNSVCRLLWSCSDSHSLEDEDGAVLQPLLLSGPNLGSPQALHCLT